MANTQTKPDTSARPPKEAMPKAKRAAKKALEIDATLAEAHTTRAQVTRLYDWKWSDAETKSKPASSARCAFSTRIEGGCSSLDSVYPKRT